MKDSSQKEELTDAQFSALYLYTLATSLEVAQIAQNEIDTIEENEYED